MTFLQSNSCYHTDQLGSIRALTNSAGSVVGTATYDAYGGVLTQTGTLTPFGYAGQYTDAATGLQYLRARYYDPTTQQFLTVDPLLAQTEQAYAYAGGSPTNGSDPSGMDSAGRSGTYSEYLNLIYYSMMTTINGIDGDFNKIKGDLNRPFYEEFFHGDSRVNGINTWFQHVRPQGKWDMKAVLQKAFVGAGQQMQKGWFTTPCTDQNNEYFYDLWGNIWLGFVGSALGFSSEELYMQGLAADAILSEGRQISSDADIYSVMAGALLWQNYQKTGSFMPEDLNRMVLAIPTPIWGGGTLARQSCE